MRIIKETCEVSTTTAKAMAKLRRNCLQCIKLTDGNVVPRPLGAQLIAEYPGEVISMDYLYIGKSSEGLCYILILVDKFSKMVRLIPTEAPTAIAAAQTIMEWAAAWNTKLAHQRRRKSFQESSFRAAGNASQHGTPHHNRLLSMGQRKC